MSTSPEDFNQRIIDEYRANDGKMSGMFEGAPMLLLHDRGAKSGQDRISPLVFLADGADWVIFASKAGADTNPAWYHNLLAHPDTKIELGSETIPVRAEEVKGEQRDVLFRAQAAERPNFAEYEQKTDRIIPVIRLTRAA